MVPVRKKRECGGGWQVWCTQRLAERTAQLAACQGGDTPALQLAELLAHLLLVRLLAGHLPTALDACGAMGPYTFFDQTQHVRWMHAGDNGQVRPSEVLPRACMAERYKHSQHWCWRRSQWREESRSVQVVDFHVLRDACKAAEAGAMAAPPRLQRRLCSAAFQVLAGSDDYIRKPELMRWHHRLLARLDAARPGALELGP